MRVGVAFEFLPNIFWRLLCIDRPVRFGKPYVVVAFQHRTDAVIIRLRSLGVVFVRDVQDGHWPRIVAHYGRGGGKRS